MKLMVLDGNSILNRSYYGIRPLTTKDGFYTQAIYGFLVTMARLEDEERPDAVCVTFDRREPTFRHLEYEGYKAQRKGMPEELAMQLPVMKEVLDAMNIPRYELAGYEADDLIGTISRRCEAAGWDCVAATGDKDSLQLITEHTTVKLISTRMGQTTTKRMTPESFAEEYGFEPIHIIAQTIGALSGGAFDPTVAPVMDAWDFTGDAPRVPSDEELSALLAHVGLEKLSVDGNTIALSDGAQLDLGGIAKGYAGDAVRTVLAEFGVTSAVIDLGGDVGLLGAKPDGSDWRVAVKDPADPSKFLGVLTAADTFVVTSGIYERGFEENGVRYHHIIDPKTGKPAESGLVSVTVMCGDGAWADALSTACFVLGEAGSLALRDTLAAEKNLRIELILVTDDGHVRYTAGLAERFEPSEEGTYVYEAIIA